MKILERAWSAGVWLLLPTLLLLASSGELPAAEEPPLPTWDAPEVPNLAPGANFSNLLPKDTGQEQVSEFFLGYPGGLTSPPLLLDDTRLNPHDLSLFLRGGLLNDSQAPAKTNPTPSLALREVPAPLLASLRQVPLNEYLIDPQSLVTEMPTLDLERLLQFHATEARILLYVLVLDRDQELSTLSKLNPLAGRLHSDRPICLAIYPLGEPWRARFMLSQEVHHSGPVASLTEMAEDCIKDALLTNDAEAQLQRFAVKLSTRLFWLEKSLPQTVPGVKAAAVLHEVIQATVPDIAAPSQAVWPVQTVGVSVLSVAVLGGIALSLRSLLRASALKKARQVWILPEPEIQPRLGGAFSGGAGAMIQYGNKIHPSRK